MAKVVAVHGIGQQFKGGAIIAREWLPAIQSSLHLAGGDIAAEELTCPFYGHLFHPPGSLAVTSHVDPVLLRKKSESFSTSGGKRRQRPRPRR